MYQDYFYEEKPKTFSLFPGVKHQKQQLDYYKDNPIKKTKKKVVVKKTTSSKKLLQIKEQQKPDNTEKQFKDMNKTTSLISVNCQDILKSNTAIAVQVMLIATSLFAINKILKTKQEKFDVSYAPSPQITSPAGQTVSGKSSGRTSEKGIRFIMNQESFIGKARDIEGQGILTIGYGHRGKDVKPGQTITKEQAYKLFKEDLKPREDAVKKYVKVPISQNMFDALVSFVYNAGVGSFKKSDILKKLNQGDYKGAAEAWKTQNIRKGSKFERGLKARRSKEAATFASDISFDNKLSSPEVIQTTSSGHINKLNNGAKIGGYKMYNPSNQRKYIALSDRAAAYLQESGGKGLVTSGAEGNHAQGKSISHAHGTKIDVVPGNGTSDEAWADLAIPFIANKNTAYINFESFSTKRFNNIKEIIYRKRPDLKAKGEGKSKYSKNGKFMFTYYNPGHGLHLDIGIIPNSYSKSSYDQEQAQKAKQLKEQQKKIQQQQAQQKAKQQAQQKTNANKPKTNNTVVRSIPNNTKQPQTKYKKLGQISSAISYQNEQARIRKGK